MYRYVLGAHPWHVYNTCGSLCATLSISSTRARWPTRSSPEPGRAGWFRKSRFVTTSAAQGCARSGRARKPDPLGRAAETCLAVSGRADDEARSGRPASNSPSVRSRRQGERATRAGGRWHSSRDRLRVRPGDGASRASGVRVRRRGGSSPRPELGPVEAVQAVLFSAGASGASMLDQGPPEGVGARGSAH